MDNENGYINIEILRDIGQEYQRAVRMHGSRFGDLPEAMSVFTEEWREAVRAYRDGDIDGEHGLRREVTQVIAVGVKILEGLRDSSILPSDELLRKSK